jgi:hypothetical protein
LKTISHSNVLISWFIKPPIIGVLALIGLSFAPAQASNTLDAKALKSLITEYRKLQVVVQAHEKRATQLASEMRSARTQQRFSAKWLPVLRAADAAGDPLAIWLLRDCTAMPLLSRADVASTCGESIQKEQAYKMLESSSFAATYSYINKARELRDKRDKPEECSGDHYRPVCDANTTVAIYERWLQAVRADGAPFLAEQHVQPFFCAVSFAHVPKSSDPKNAVADENCLEIQQRSRSVQQLIPEYLHSSLLREWRSFYNDGPVEFQKMSPPQLMEKDRNNPEDAAALLAASASFYGRVFDEIGRIESAMAAKIKADPRLAQLVFNVSDEFAATPQGTAWKKSLKEGVGWLRPIKVTHKVSSENGEKAATKYTGVNERDRAYGQRYAGVFKGPLISNGTSHVITNFFSSGGGPIGGRYLMFYGREPGARVERGDLGPCIPTTPSELVCMWKDVFGAGMVSFLFNADASEFKGEWRKNEDYVHGSSNSLIRVEPRWWKERTSWNGSRQ